MMNPQRQFRFFTIITLVMSLLYPSIAAAPLDGHKPITAQIAAEEKRILHNNLKVNSDEYYKLISQVKYNESKPDVAQNSSKNIGRYDDIAGNVELKKPNVQTVRLKRAPQPRRRSRIAILPVLNG